MASAGQSKFVRTSSGELARFDYDGLRAIVIDRDDESRGSVISALNGIGIKQVYGAHSAHDALSEASDIEYHFIVTDIEIGEEGETDGLEFLRQIRTDATPLDPDFPVLFLSQKADFFSVKEAMDLGADAFMIRPVSRKKLELRINHVIEKSFPERIEWANGKKRGSWD